MSGVKAGFKLFRRQNHVKNCSTTLKGYLNRIKRLNFCQILSTGEMSVWADLPRDRFPTVADYVTQTHMDPHFEPNFDFAFDGIPRVPIKSGIDASLAHPHGFDIKGFEHESFVSHGRHGEIGTSAGGRRPRRGPGRVLGCPE